MRAVIALINYNPQRMIYSIVCVYMCVTDAAIMFKKHAVRVLLTPLARNRVLRTAPNHYCLVIITYVFCAHACLV